MSKPSEYYLNTKKGMSKKAAAKLAGYKHTNTTAIENTKQFQEIKLVYKDVLLKEISLQRIAKEQVKVIEQDEDLGAKNTAIKMALDKIEPEEIHTPNDDDKFLVVLRTNNSNNLKQINGQV